MNRFIIPLFLILLTFSYNTKAQKETDNEEILIEETIEVEMPALGTKYNPKKMNIEGEDYNVIDLDKTYQSFYNAKSKNNMGILKNGKVILPPIFNYYDKHKIGINNKKIPLSIGYRFGIYDLAKETWQLPIQYNDINPLTKKYYQVTKAGKISIYNVISEKFVRKNEWDELQHHYLLDKRQLYVVINKEKRKEYRGIYNAINNKVVIPIIYDKIIFKIKNNLFLVEKNKKFNLISLDNKIIYQNWYDQITELKNRRFLVKKGNTYKIIEIDEKSVNNKAYLFLEKVNYYDGAYIIAKNKLGKYGFINENGQNITKFIYDSIKTNSYNSLQQIVSSQGKTGVFGKKNRKQYEVLPITYDEIKAIRGFYLVKKNNLFGLYSNKGKEILETRFSKINFLKRSYRVDKCFYATENNKSYIVRNRKVIEIPHIIINKLSNYLEAFQGTRYLVVQNKNNKQGLIDLNGKIVVPYQFDKIVTKLRKQNIIVEKNHLKGIYSIKDNKLIVPIKYEQIIPNGRRNTVIALIGNKATEIKIN